MDEDLDVHGRKRRLTLALRNVTNSNINAENKRSILDFCNYCSAQGSGDHKTEHYGRLLKKIAGWMSQPFEDATKEDFIKLVGGIEKGRFSEWTKRDYKIAVKIFFKWLKKRETYPEEIAWIKATSPGNKKTPEEILKEKEVQKLVEACTDTQIKALLTVLWDTGATQSPKTRKLERQTLLTWNLRPLWRLVACVSIVHYTTSSAIKNVNIR